MSVSKEALSYLIGKCQSGLNCDALAEIFLNPNTPKMALDYTLGIKKPININSQEAILEGYDCVVKDVSLIDGIVYYRSAKDDYCRVEKASVAYWNSCCK